jgi:hypothetical protein
VAPSVGAPVSMGWRATIAATTTEVMPNAAADAHRRGRDSRSLGLPRANSIVERDLAGVQPHQLRQAAEPPGLKAWLGLTARPARTGSSETER